MRRSPCCQVVPSRPTPPSTPRRARRSAAMRSRRVPLTAHVETRSDREVAELTRSPSPRVDGDGAKARRAGPAAGPAHPPASRVLLRSYALPPVSSGHGRIAVNLPAVDLASHHGVAAEAPLERSLTASVNSGQEKLTLLTQVGLAGTLTIAPDLVISSSGSIQASDRRGAGGKFQSLFWDIRIKEWWHPNAKP